MTGESQVPHESGAQPWDGAEPEPNKEVRHVDLAGDREAAWLSKHPADSPLTKFARVWEGDSNSGTVELTGEGDH